MKNIIELLSSNADYTYFIAEIGLNHNGSIDIVKKLILEAVNSGADAVKLQKRDVENLATREVLDKKDDRFPEFGTTYREIREHLEFNKDEYQEIKQFCNNQSIDFLCTAFDINSAKFLIDLDIDFFKVASHSVTHIPLIEFLAKKRIPIILSTGMSELEDIDLAYKIFKKNDTKLILLHCVSSYPTPDDELNLNIINTLKSRYPDCHIGYSGHEIGYIPTLAAVAKGARLVERHITLDKKMLGFDHSLSIVPSELKEMIENIRRIETFMGTSEKKVTEVELFKKNQYNVSMVANRDLKQGETLSYEDVIFKNPGTGILYKDSSKVIGGQILVPIAQDMLINENQIKKS